MIDPVSHPIAIVHAATEFSNTPLSTDTNSTLSSADSNESPGLLGHLSAIGSGIVSALVSVFSYLASWIFPTKSKETEVPISYTPQLPTRDENSQPPSEDIFEELLFVTNELGKIEFRNKKAYELTHKLFFKYMGGGGVRFWLANYSTIKNLQIQLGKTPHHPLELLTFLFLSKELTTSVANFHSTCQSRLIGWGCSVVGEENPWVQFIDKQVDNFQFQSESIPKMYKGFAKTLQLDEETVLKYVNKENWKGLVNYTIQSRRKYFSI